MGTGLSQLQWLLSATLPLAAGCGKRLPSQRRLGCRARSSVVERFAVHRQLTKADSTTLQA